MSKHCCTQMDEALDFSCSQHASKYDCPDSLISYSECFDEYGLIIHDGGSSVINISYCPWCGKKLPDSKRDRWFDELESLGFDEPSEQDIPENYKTNKWYLS